jgi:mono/diheme cytochrome c family protein
VQFYVFGGGESPAPRIAFADLDGLGPKPVPFLCMVCHGGGPSLNANDRVEHARFREFDLPSFRYSSGRSWDFGETSLSNAELDDYAALNQKVHDAHTGTPIGDLIDNWYTGPFSGAPQEPQVPSGWATEENVYHEVYAKACRTCHIARDGGFALVFDSSAQLGGTAYVVCDIGDVGVRRMPNASVTYRNFWADTNSVLLYETLTGQPAGSCDDLRTHVKCVTRQMVGKLVAEIGSLYQGAARRIRTRLHLDRDAVAYAAQRPRHSARAAALFRLKFCLLDRLRS